MSQLEKKCLVASAGAHVLLWLLLALSSLLWTAKRQKISLPILTFIPSRLVDGSTGGGSPNAKTLPAAASPLAARPLMVAPSPPPAAPKAETAPPKPEAKPAKQAEAVAKPRHQKGGEPVPVEKKTRDTDETDDSGDSKSSRKNKVKVSLVRDTGASREKSAAQAAAEAEASSRAAQALYAAKVNGVLGAIGMGVSSGTVIDIPGPGGGAYADYAQWVQAVYQRAWSPPNDLADELATVTATVVIRRDGSVESFKITRHSAHATLDKSVDRLRHVTFVARFPDGAQDDKRTFVIDFNLKAKKPFG